MSSRALAKARAGRLETVTPQDVRELLRIERLKLIAKDRERRRTAEAKRLQQEAERIAEILNKDFDVWRAEFRKAAGRLGKDLGHFVGLGHEGSEVLPGEGEQPSEFVMTGPPDHGGTGGADPGREGEQDRPGSGLRPGASTGSATGGEGPERRRRAGGFAIQYDQETESERRSRYDEESRTIHINLDHPQIAAAKSAGIESRAFQQLSYEVAFTEYALALPMEMARAQGSFFDAQDAIVEARLTLDRIARLGAALYRND